MSNLGDLEEIASQKGGIRHLLDEKRRKVYKASASRGLFTAQELRTTRST